NSKSIPVCRGGWGGSSMTVSDHPDACRARSGTKCSPSEGELVLARGRIVARRLVVRGLGRHHVDLPALLLQGEKPLLLHSLQQAGEAGETVVALVEVGLLADDGLLDDRRVQGRRGPRQQIGDDLTSDGRHLSLLPG